MKKTIIIAISAVILIMIGSLAAIKFLTEDSWICTDGKWVKHGNPSAPMPAAGCGQSEGDAEGKSQTGKTDGSTKNQDQPSMPDQIKVVSPEKDQEISSPLTIEGQARGGWFFEASFPVRLEDSDGKVLAYGAAQALSDWMTPEFVPFRAVLDYTAPSSTEGTLVLSKDNPSGLPEHDAEVRVPVKFGEEAKGTTTLKIFFMNNALDPEVTCTKAFPVERTIPKTPAVGKAAIEALLKGPTEEEKARGYSTSLPESGLEIRSLAIEAGTAKIDFNEALDKGVAGSCLVSAIRTQIEETLKQFPTVSRVEISINGRTGDILQP